MIIRKNTPLYGGGQRRAFSGQKARQCVPQCILGGVAVLFTVRKHACAPHRGIFADNRKEKRGFGVQENPESTLVLYVKPWTGIICRQSCRSRLSHP